MLPKLLIPLAFDMILCPLQNTGIHTDFILSQSWLIDIAKGDCVIRLNFESVHTTHVCPVYNFTSSIVWDPHEADKRKIYACFIWSFICLCLFLFDLNVR